MEAARPKFPEYWEIFVVRDLLYMHVACDINSVVFIFCAQRCDISSFDHTGMAENGKLAMQLTAYQFEVQKLGYCDRVCAGLERCPYQVPCA